MQLKRFIFFAFFQIIVLSLSAQTDSNNTPVKQTEPANNKPDSVIKVIVQKRDSSKKKLDSLLTAAVDSVAINDSLKAIAIADSLRKDSLQKAAVAKQTKIDTSTYASLFTHPFLPFGKPPTYQILQARQPEQQDELFYVLTGVVLFIALMKIISPKYFNNIFSIFFQTSFRQKHTRD